jgi:hypothetical protein
VIRERLEIRAISETNENNEYRAYKGRKEILEKNERKEIHEKNERKVVTDSMVLMVRIEKMGRKEKIEALILAKKSSLNSLN